MKSSKVFILSIFLGVFLASCSSSIEEKLSGEWHATDVKIEAEDGKYTRERTDALRRMEKSVVFVFNEDKTMKAYTGESAIDGTWFYDEDDDGIYVLFEGSDKDDKTLLGHYTGGKIRKEHSSEGLLIETIYEKR
jgi:hypothetical protein